MLVILLLTCTTIGSINIGTVSGIELPVIYVDPPTSTAAPNETFAVNIKVANITVEESLYSWQFRMIFNTTVLDAVSVVEGPFLKTVGDQYYGSYFRSKRMNAYGYVEALEMLLYNSTTGEFPPYGAVGNGTLCTITFKVQAEGATLLHFESTELYTIISKTLYPITHTWKDGFFEYPLRVHDIAVTNVTPSPASVPLGENMSINVTVENQGEATETFSVTAYANTTEIGTLEVTDLGAGTQTTLSFIWDTTGVPPGNYRISAQASIVPGETERADNTYTDGIVKVMLEHDVAVTSLDAPTKATLGDLVSVNVTVANEGVSIENFTVTVYCDSSIVGTRNVVNLASGNAEIVEFSWNTTGLGVGVYTINATATIALDGDPGDNFKTTTIEIKPYVFTVTGPEWEFNVIVDSNSSVSSFDFRQGDKEIKFSVTGPEGTAGFCNVTIPTGLMTGSPWIILINGVVTSPIQSGNGTHTFLYFTYTHSTKDVIIRGTWVVPEFPTLVPMLLTLAFLAVSTIVLKRKTGNNC